MGVSMIYRIARKISWQAVDNILWIIDEETQELYVTYNEVSVLIWKQLFDGEDDETIKSNLFDIYQVQQINSDVQEFINGLLNKGIIEYGKTV